MRKNILVAKFNRIEIVFTETFKKDIKHNNEKIALYEVSTNKGKHSGIVWFTDEFENSFDILYAQLQCIDSKLNNELKSKFAVKYFTGVL